MHCSNALQGQDSEVQEEATAALVTLLSGPPESQAALIEAMGALTAALPPAAVLAPDAAAAATAAARIAVSQGDG